MRRHGGMGEQLQHRRRVGAGWQLRHHLLA
jgi:hypothetical protein